MLRVTVISGARAGTRVELSRPVIRLGRAADNDIVFDPDRDADVSAHHAELRLENGLWTIVDLQSRNGLALIAPQGLIPITRHVLGARDRVQLGAQGPIVEIEPIVESEVAPPPSARVQALVDMNVRRATGPLRAVIAVLAALVLVAAGAIVWLAVRKEDPKRLRKELEQLSMNDPRRTQIEKKLGQTEGDHADVGHSIYEANKDALFMLVAHHRTDGVDKWEHGGFCTAFAVQPRILASNAHCVRAAEDFEDDGAEIYAHLNESSKDGKPKMLRVGKHRGHPAYRHNAQNITPDVGLFELEDEDAPTTVTTATMDELQQLGTGDPLYVLGFPGRTMDEDSPVAVFMFSHVGRITDEFGQRADDFRDAWLVQHEGQTTPGTSGSPIFDGMGHVVAINAGGLLEQNQQAVYKYAMRIDLLQAIDLNAPEK